MRRKSTFRLVLEVLEDRVVPTISSAFEVLQDPVVATTHPTGRDLYWNPPSISSHDYETAANWHVGSPIGAAATTGPASIDNIHFTTGTNVRVSCVLNGDASVNGFEMDSSATGTQAWLLLNGHIFTVQDAHTANLTPQFTFRYGDIWMDEYGASELDIVTDVNYTYSWSGSFGDADINDELHGGGEVNISGTGNLQIHGGGKHAEASFTVMSGAGMELCQDFYGAFALDQAGKIEVQADASFGISTSSTTPFNPEITRSNSNANVLENYGTITKRAGGIGATGGSPSILLPIVNYGDLDVEDGTLHVVDVSAGSYGVDQQGSSAVTSIYVGAALDCGTGMNMDGGLLEVVGGGPGTATLIGSRGHNFGGGTINISSEWGISLAVQGIVDVGEYCTVYILLGANSGDNTALTCDSDINIASGSTLVGVQGAAPSASDMVYKIMQTTGSVNGNFSTRLLNNLVGSSLDIAYTPSVTANTYTLTSV